MSTQPTFSNRQEAGQALAVELQHLEARAPIVVGLPRGGVAVAQEVAVKLGAPLDVLVVRKLGAPNQPELAMGAAAEGGVVLLNKQILRRLRVPKTVVQAAIDEANDLIKQRVALYRGEREPESLDGRLVVLVDDGLATGATMRVAIGAARHLGAAEVVVAVPVGSPRTIADLRTQVDDVVCVHAPSQLRSVGEHYRDFRQVSDAEVLALLA